MEQLPRAQDHHAVAWLCKVQPALVGLGALEKATAADDVCCPTHQVRLERRCVHERGERGHAAAGEPAPPERLPNIQPLLAEAPLGCKQRFCCHQTISDVAQGTDGNAALARCGGLEERRRVHHGMHFEPVAADARKRCYINPALAARTLSQSGMAPSMASTAHRTRSSAGALSVGAPPPKSPRRSGAVCVGLGFSCRFRAQAAGASRAAKPHTLPAACSAPHPPLPLTMPAYPLGHSAVRSAPLGSSPSAERSVRNSGASTSAPLRSSHSISCVILSPTSVAAREQCRVTCGRHHASPTPSPAPSYHPHSSLSSTNTRKAPARRPRHQ